MSPLHAARAGAGGGLVRAIVVCGAALRAPARARRAVRRRPRRGAAAGVWAEMSRALRLCLLAAPLVVAINLLANRNGLTVVRAPRRRPAVRAGRPHRRGARLRRAWRCGWPPWCSSPRCSPRRSTSTRSCSARGGCPPARRSPRCSPSGSCPCSPATRGASTRRVAAARTAAAPAPRRSRGPARDLRRGARPGRRRRDDARGPRLRRPRAAAAPSRAVVAAGPRVRGVRPRDPRPRGRRARRRASRRSARSRRSMRRSARRAGARRRAGAVRLAPFAVRRGMR